MDVVSYSVRMISVCTIRLEYLPMTILSDFSRGVLALVSVCDDMSIADSSKSGRGGRWMGTGHGKQLGGMSCMNSICSYTILY